MIAGIGLRTPHVAAVLDTRPAVGWFEAHCENYFGGSILADGLLAVRRDYPVALHGVAMGLLSPGELDPVHLYELERLVERVEPMLVSEHLCWSRQGNIHTHDLLPAPAIQAALDLAVTRIDQVQTRLKRRIAIENITRYVSFCASTMSEGVFLAEVARRSGCGILLDLENLALNERNLGERAHDVMAALPSDAVVEFHLAGHDPAAQGLQRDNHGAPVGETVWALLQTALDRFGPQPVLIERDNNLPPLASLVEECDRAGRMVRQ